MLAVDLHGCEIWSLALKKETEGKPFENRVLRKVFGVVEKTS